MAKFNRGCPFPSPFQSACAAEWDKHPRHRAVRLKTKQDPPHAPGHEALCCSVRFSPGQRVEEK